MRHTTPTIAGWGRIPVPGRELRSENLEALTRDAPISRGLGRSYGDSSLPPPSRDSVATTTLADRVLAFDPRTGRLRAEAGLSLYALNRLTIPRGYFVPVTPGTQYVTLGGMLAADVHGKEHHARGCIGEHVARIKMRVADGRVLWCSPDEHPELFRATLGGMGLTGHMLEVELALRAIPSPWIRQHSKRVGDIDEYVDALKQAAKVWPYTVGWIDCLSRGREMGRGILIAGDWLDPRAAPTHPPAAQRGLSVPLELPGWALGRPSVRAFNAAMYRSHVPRERDQVVSWESFFYPLDRVQHWNRMYGRRGFTQYQCVLPERAGHGAARRLLEILTRRGGASFLCVIKDCGPEGRGTLSFPMAGISIALDIPVRDDTQALVDALNEEVIREGGRIYLAKDTFTRPEHFRAMEPRLPAFERVRRAWDPACRLRSAQSVRLFGDRP